MKLLAIAGLILISVNAVAQSPATTNRFRFSGRIDDGAAYEIMLVSPGGSFVGATADENGRFSLNAPLSRFRNSSLHIKDSAGNYLGPVVLKRAGRKLSMTFDPQSAVSLPGQLIRQEAGYFTLRRSVDSAHLSPRTIRASSEGAPQGATAQGVVEMSRVVPSADEPGEDYDKDGYINAFDQDDDGDRITDLVDSDTTNASGISTAAEGDVATAPMVALFLDMNSTLNENIAPVSNSDIDTTMSGANAFSATFFHVNLPSDTTNGHIICPELQTWCAQGTTSVLGGVSESNPLYRDIPWGTFDLDGSGYPNLEPLTLAGGYSALVAGVQPRVGRDQFAPGQVVQTIFTDSAGATTGTTVEIVPTYPVTVPALRGYNSGGGDGTIDYTANPLPGSSIGNAITLTSGTVTLTFFRPQRLPLGTETGLQDIGGAQYGILINNNSGEFTCAPDITAFSSSLTLNPDPLGTGGSRQSNTGADLFPLTDTSTDATPDPTQFLSVTLNLSTCLAAQGLSAGTHQVTLQAVGRDMLTGNNRAAQTIFFTIP